MEIRKKGSVIFFEDAEIKQGRRKVWKSGRVVSNVVDIIFSPECGRIYWSAKIWRGDLPLPPTGFRPFCQVIDDVRSGL